MTSDRTLMFLEAAEAGQVVARQLAANAGVASEPAFSNDSPCGTRTIFTARTTTNWRMVFTPQPNTASPTCTAVPSA